MKALLSRASLLVLLFLMLATRPASACAACYGDISGNKMTYAASWGIIAMVIIMFAMLGAVAGFGYYLSYRAKHPLPDYDDLLNEDSTLPKPEPTA